MYLSPRRERDCCQEQCCSTDRIEKMEGFHKNVRVDSRAEIGSVVSADASEGMPMCEIRTMAGRVREFRRTIEEIRQRIGEKRGGSLKVMRAEMMRVREVRAEIALAIDTLCGTQRNSHQGIRNIRGANSSDLVPALCQEAAFDVVPF